MKKYIKIPKEIQKELELANNYSIKLNQCIANFEQWILENVDEKFDIDVLRASGNVEMFSEDARNQTEALSEIEYGTGVDIQALEHTINYFANKNCIL